jgi:hypothetical protein
LDPRRVVALGLHLIIPHHSTSFASQILGAQVLEKGESL